MTRDTAKICICFCLVIVNFSHVCCDATLFNVYVGPQFAAVIFLSFFLPPFY